MYNLRTENSVSSTSCRSLSLCNFILSMFRLEFAIMSGLGPGIYLAHLSIVRDVYLIAAISESM